MRGISPFVLIGLVVAAGSAHAAPRVPGLPVLHRHAATAFYGVEEAPPARIGDVPIEPWGGPPPPIALEEWGVPIAPAVDEAIAPAPTELEEWGVPLAPPLDGAIAPFADEKAEIALAAALDPVIAPPIPAVEPDPSPATELVSSARPIARFIERVRTAFEIVRSLPRLHPLKHGLGVGPGPAHRPHRLVLF